MVIYVKSHLQLVHKKFGGFCCCLLEVGQAYGSLEMIPLTMTMLARTSLIIYIFKHLSFGSNKLIYGNCRKYHENEGHRSYNSCRNSNSIAMENDFRQMAIIVVFGYFSSITFRFCGSKCQSSIIAMTAFAWSSWVRYLQRTHNYIHSKPFQFRPSSFIWSYKTLD